MAKNNSTNTNKVKRETGLVVKDNMIGNPGVFSINAKLGIQILLNTTDMQKENVSEFLSILTGSFRNMRVSKSNTSASTGKSDIICDIYGETEGELISAKETIQNTYNEFVVTEKVKNDVNTLTISHKLFYDIDLTDFYKNQPADIIGVGVFYISDCKKKFGKQLLNVGIDTLYVPNPRYVNVDYKIFKSILSFYSTHNKRTRIELPYPIGEKETNPTKILTRTGKLNNKCALIPFVLKTPFTVSNEDKTVHTIPSVSSMYNYKLRQDNETGKILKASLYKDYDNQYLENSSLLEMLRTLANDWIYKSYLRKPVENQQVSIVNMYHLSQNILNYFCFNTYDKKIIKLENIMCLEQDAPLNEKIYAPKTPIRNRRRNRNNNNDKNQNKRTSNKGNNRRSNRNVQKNNRPNVRKNDPVKKMQNNDPSSVTYKPFANI